MTLLTSSWRKPLRAWRCSIKSSCGFLGLPRLEKVAYAGEDVLGRFRDGELIPEPASVTLILKCVDQIRTIVDHLSKHGAEGDGDDSAMIGELKAILEGGSSPAVVQAAPASGGGPVVAEGGFPVAADLLAEFQNIAVPAAPAPPQTDFPVPAELLTKSSG